MADRIVIKINPPPDGDGGLLRVSDAMLQVIDALRLFEEAETALGDDHQTFEWRLERASTASPFTVTAIAEPIEPNVEISAHVRRVKTKVSQDLRNLVRTGQVPDWMNLQPMSPMQNFLHRSLNGIGSTEIDFENNDVLSVDRVAADIATSAIEARTAIDVFDLPEREAFGEVEGVMVAAGRYRNQPAIQIRTELYGFIWCTLSRKIVEKFGDEHSMKDVWEGKTVGVQGLLSYGPGAKLMRIAVTDIREMPIAPLVDLDSVLDPNFTSGLSPTDYLDHLHEGELTRSAHAP